MRTPNVKNVVSEKKIWELCIEFISTIDRNLVEYNLVLAYIVYLISKERRLGEGNIKKMVFISCFHDIGRLNAKERNSTSEIETYLFLKYFSPMKNFAKVVLKDESNDYSNIFHFAKKYTTLLIEQNNPYDAFNAIDKRDFDIKVYKTLEKVLKIFDLKEELNSMHYKCVIYSLIQKSIYKRNENAKLITMLSSLFEMYSKQTLFHSKSCAQIAYFIAKKIKRPTLDTKKIYVAGLIHDLGKVRVPKTILEKDSKLTDEEYVEMKKHVIYTRKLLRHIIDFDIIELACRHHEKINGTGYPMHLDRDHMTLNQKIIQVADIVSALTGKRSYKSAWSADDVIKELTYIQNHDLIDKDVYNIVVKYKKQIMKITDTTQQTAENIFAKIETERIRLVKEA